MLRVVEYFAKSLEVIQGHSKWHHSIDRIVTIMALSCIISKINPDNCRKSQLFMPPAFDAPLGDPRGNIAIRFGIEKLEWRGCPMWKWVWGLWLLVLIQYTNVWQTARQTDRHCMTALAALIYCVTSCGNSNNNGRTPSGGWKKFLKMWKLWNRCTART